MHLTTLFDLSLVERRDEPALEYADGGGRLHALTFGDVEARAARTADELAARGLGRGDRLCVYLPNRVEFVDLFLACVRLGVLFVPVNVLYRERELRHIVGDADPAAVVVDGPGHAALFPPGTPLWPVDELAAAAAARRPAGRGVAPLDGDDPALVVYTSGTTGASKGAVLTHNNLAANAANLVTCWRITSADRYLAVLPLFHVHGLGNGVHAWLASGCRMRLAERFEHASAAPLFADFRPTLFFGVPTIYVRLLALPPEAARAIGESVRLFVSGSAPLPAHVHEAFRARYGHTILERYGMTETLMNVSNPYAGERRPGTVGLPLPGVSVRLVGDDGRPVADGEVGEVHVRGPNVFAGYWRRPEATAEAFTADGWFRTGDLGVRAPDGYYTLRGRRGDVIISSGFNIYPREVEELLLELPGVREAAVVGAPDALRGEVAVAYVAADGAVDAAALEAACRAQLASFKVPRAFVRVDALPRTALGKVQRHLLPPWPGERPAPGAS